MKSSLYKLYFFYFKHFPVQRGKSFLGRLLYKIIGNAVFAFDNAKYELHPLSLIDRMLIEDGYYENDIFEMIKYSLEENGGVLLDIGANFGLFTIPAAKLPNVFVFSFEPSTREVQRLYRNISLNKLTNVTVFPFGLRKRLYSQTKYFQQY